MMWHWHIHCCVLYLSFRYSTMSLFKARDWWATKAGDDEVFDLGCFTVGNVDNASQPSGIICVIHLM